MGPVPERAAHRARGLVRGEVGTMGTLDQR
jgi:hypothetical protein